MASSISALHSLISCRFCASAPTSSYTRSPPRTLLSPPPRPGRIASSFRSRGREPVLERRRTGARAVAEEVTLGSEGGGAAEAKQPVSPSDMLTLFFKAEGTMAESAISSVTKSLEELEGVSDLKVQVVEGLATVELTKQATVLDTTVGSNLVETIQGSGFKLQTLTLSFEDEEDPTGLSYVDDETDIYVDDL